MTVCLSRAFVTSPRREVVISVARDISEIIYAMHVRNIYKRKITIYRSLFRSELCFLMQYIRGEVLAWIIYLLCNFKGLFEINHC